jgi:hypothetical protein
LEAATGRKEARRRRWSGVEEKGSGREREVVAIAAAATESMGGDGEEGGAAGGVRFFSSWAGRGRQRNELVFFFFLKERVRINGGCWPHIHTCSVWSVSQKFLGPFWKLSFVEILYYSAYMHNIKII